MYNTYSIYTRMYIHTHIYMNSKPVYTNESSTLGFEFICCLSNDYGDYGTTS